jgi:tRNA(fMet)-specific endonuclease VapC
MKRLLDTNICVAYLNGGDARVRDQLLALSPSDVCLCSVVKAELLYGARKSRRVNENLARLIEMFATMESLPFDDNAAEHYGLLRAHLESAGTLIGANDMLIAATAIAAGVTLVTRNQREFLRVVGLSVEIW